MFFTEKNQISFQFEQSAFKLSSFVLINVSLIVVRKAHI